MPGGERHGVLIEQARLARGSLARALELLQRPRAPRAQAARAVERLARASNALYRAEVESTTPQATTQGIHLAVEELRHALNALHAGGLTSEGEAAGAVVAGALAVLYPLVSATRRARRKVVIVREGSDGAPKTVGSRPPRRTPSLRSRAAPIERRAAQSPRLPLRLAVDLTVAGTAWSSVSANISRGGLFVISDRLLPAGTEVTVGFVLPNGHAVVARGTVRWTRSAHQQQPGMGLCFRGLSAQDGQQLANYCRR